jgi:hypothetical protein
VSAAPWSDAATPVWALVSGLPSPLRENQRILMLQAFIDESLSHEKPAVFVMAGFISTAEKWAAFSDEWQRVCDATPRLSHLKMNDAMRLKGEFAGWSATQRDQKLQLFLDAIADHAKGAIFCTLQHDIYRAVFKENEKLPRALKSPYFFLLYAIIEKLANNQQELGLDGPVDFIFDDQVIEKPRIIEAWDLFKAAAPVPRHLIGQTPAFQDDKRVLPLQAADIIAWVIRNRIQRASHGLQQLQLPSRSPGKPNCPTIGYSWNETMLREIRKEIEQEKPLIASWGKFEFFSNDPDPWKTGQSS